MQHGFSTGRGVKKGDEGDVGAIESQYQVLKRSHISKLLRDNSEEELNSSPLMPGIGERYGAPMGVIHRGNLQRFLLPAALRLGCRILTSQTVLAAGSGFTPRVKVRVGEGKQKGRIV